MGEVGYLETWRCFLGRNLLPRILASMQGKLSSFWCYSVAYLPWFVCLHQRRCWFLECLAWRVASSYPLAIFSPTHFASDCSRYWSPSFACPPLLFSDGLTGFSTLVALSVHLQHHTITLYVHNRHYELRTVPGPWRTIKTMTMAPRTIPNLPNNKKCRGRRSDPRRETGLLNPLSSVRSRMQGHAGM